MIICQCNIISKSDVEDAVRGLLAEDAWIHLTPGTMMKALEKRGKCFGCFPSLINVMITVIEDIRERDEAVHPEWADMTVTRLRLLSERRSARQNAANRDQNRIRRARTTIRA